MKRRRLLQGAVVGLLSLHLSVQAAQPAIDVYKSATCGCCSKWVEHLQANGFQVSARDVSSPADYRQKFGMPDALGSCHTAIVQGYAIEGHVPAQEIKRLLAEKRKVKGLAVPSMPLGSPGMEGKRNDPYDVFLVHMDGRHTIYRHYPGS